MTGKKYNYLDPWPDWWHSHGRKMNMELCDKKARSIIIRSKCAVLLIEERKEDQWLVRWSINHLFPDYGVAGKLIFSTSELSSAFSTKNFTIRSESKWLEDLYGATAAVGGKFIRYKDFLNIPCPGTGNDGDPNLSIKVDKKMEELVQELLLREAVCV